MDQTTSLKAMLANQENAQHSTGPKTAAGKQRSKMNAFRHGVTGQNLMISDEEKPEYLQFGLRWLHELDPVGIQETTLVQHIIDHHWRLFRLEAIQNNLLHASCMENETDAGHDDRTEVMLSGARAWREDGARLDLMGRYEGRILRQLKSFKEELRALRRERLENQCAGIETRRAPMNAPLWYEAAFQEALEAWKKLKEQRKAQQNKPVPAEVGSFGSEAKPVVETLAKVIEILKTTTPISARPALKEPKAA